MAAASATDKTLLPGTMAGEYRLGAKLGEGGMGVVYAGQHPVIGKRVAVKVLSSECASDPDLVRRFLEEARAVNKIGHPNIIDIFAFGQLPDGRQYFVMEYLDGQSLSERLEGGTIPPAELRRLLRQICSALEAAHRAGIIHRDLKPENIWIATPREEDSYAKLLDFGIAKLVDLDTSKITQTGAAMGSPQFMPPEQCMGRAIDRRADIYAMGVILYRIFTGKMPFEGRSLPELIYQQTTQDPVRPTRHRTMAPEIERIILECLEKDPDRRPATAKGLSDRLERAFTLGRSGVASPIETTWARVPEGNEKQADSAPIVVGTPDTGGSAGVVDGRGDGAGTGEGTGDVVGRTTRPDRPVGSGRGVSGGALAAVSRPNRTRFLLFVGGGCLVVSAIALVVRSARDRGGHVATVGVGATGVAPEKKSTEPSTMPALPAAPSSRLGPQVRPLAPPPGPNVAVHLRSTPSGARVVNTADGSVLGKTPLEIARPRGSGLLGIRLDLRGWKSVSADVPLWLDFDHSYELEKVATLPQKASSPTAPAVGPPAAVSAGSPPPSPARPVVDPFPFGPESARRRAAPTAGAVPGAPASPSQPGSSPRSAPRPWTDPFAPGPAGKGAIPTPSVAPTKPGSSQSPPSATPSATPSPPPSPPRPPEPAKRTPLRI